MHRMEYVRYRLDVLSSFFGTVIDKAKHGPSVVIFKTSSVLVSVLDKFARVTDREFDELLV